MGTIQLGSALYSVGVLNPGLRVFDIVVNSPYGSSYNAYLLTGAKNVLIETVHLDYWDEYLANITSVVPPEDIDYLVMNHNEPDHSGSVARLLALFPRLTVVCTQAGKKHLEDITNQKFPCQVVKAGDRLDLGDRVLEFYPSPMLHWADSMFTRSVADGVLFTCDFLGAHYCEPSLLDSRVHYPDAYLAQVEHYFNCIFGPFKPFVLAGLDKIDGMDPPPKMICPSHGPCLTGRMDEVKALYRAWSTPLPRACKRAAVLYCSAYGCTGALARATADALEACGLEVALRDVTFTPLSEAAALANDCDLLAVGSPTINRDAPKAIWDVLSSIDAVNSKGKPALVFGSYGWSGEAVEMLRTRLAGLKYKVADAGVRVLFTPTEADLSAVAALAGETAAQLENGRA